MMVIAGDTHCFLNMNIYLFEINKERIKKMKLNKDFVERNLEKAEGACMFGVPLEELSQKELIACVVADSIRRTEEQTRREKRLLFNLK